MTWCEELTHWKRPWYWERLKAGGEGDDRGWDGWMASLTINMSLSRLWELVMDREAWCAVVHGVTKSQTRLSDWTDRIDPSQGRGPILIFLLSFLSDYMQKQCIHFLQPWLYNDPSAIFQLVFSENSSTCKRNFDVFLRGGEFHVLLLCHLDLNSSIVWF